jgi:hypothetical protein
MNEDEYYEYEVYREEFNQDEIDLIIDYDDISDDEK